MNAKAGLDFIVNKTDWHTHRFAESDGPPALESGQVLFRVNRFALTANNISYALSGEGLGYWRFFPTDEGWGRIPAMGFGDVIASKHPDVSEGTRCFGFYPMSRYLVIQPGKVSAGRIPDAAPHREGLAPVYGDYTPVVNDPNYSAAHEDQTALLRGLFMTSFLAEDFLSDSDLFGAGAVLISSASSKTSIALGFCVSQRGTAKSIGLTSKRNLEFVKGLGCYDQVLLYDEIRSLPVAPAVLVDMAGDAEVLRAVHTHFGDELRHSCRIGATHWEAAGDTGELPGAKPQFFFAPAQIQKRSKDWGPQGLQERIGASWSAFRDSTDSWLRVQRGYGADELVRVYEATLNGRTAPADGHVISLWNDEDAAAGR